VTWKRFVGGVKKRVSIIVALRARVADARVRIRRRHRQIVFVHPRNENRADGVIERRLQSFVAVRRLTVGIDQGQAMIEREFADVRVMPNFVGRFKDRRGDAVINSQREEGGDNQNEPAIDRELRTNHRSYSNRKWESSKYI